MKRLLTINVHSKIPLYRQIVDAIEEGIRGGAFRHLDPLPTQEAFERVYFISAIVVKQAYAILRQSEKIITIQGKGSFINLRPKVEFDYYLFTPRMAKEFENMKVFYQGSFYMNELHKLLFQSPKSERLLCIKRIAYHQNLPILFQKIYVRADSGLVMDKLLSQYPMEIFSKYPNLKTTLTYLATPSNEETQIVLQLNPHAITHTWKLDIKQDEHILAVVFYYAPAEQVTLRRED
jgi:DNA-binding GntR family transcriptional regulator